MPDQKNDIQNVIANSGDFKAAQAFKHGMGAHKESAPQEPTQAAAAANYLTGMSASDWYIDNLMPPEKEGGFFILASARLGKDWKENGYSTKAALKKAAQVQVGKNRDIYVGCGRFASKQRKGMKLDTNGIFNITVRADLDAGEKKPGELRDYHDKAEVKTALVSALKKGGLPLPTIIDSGMGLHLYWVFSDDNGPQEMDVDLWEHVANRLVVKLIELGLKVDDSVTDGVERVMRLPGSLNYKPEQYGHADPTPQPVRVIHQAKPTTYRAFTDAMEHENVAVLDQGQRVDNPVNAMPGAEVSADDMSGQSYPTYVYDREEALSVISALPIEFEYTDKNGRTKKASINEEKGFSIIANCVAGILVNAPASDHKTILDALDAKCKEAGGSTANNKKKIAGYIKKWESGKGYYGPGLLFAIASKDGWSSPITPGGVSPGGYVGEDIGAESEEGMNNPDNWEYPTPLPFDLPSVPVLQPGLMPGHIRGFAHDISERIQCPLEFTAVATITMLGSLIGTQLGVRPKSKDNWTVLSNFYADLIGPPAAMKSPALSEVMKPLGRLEAEAAKHHKQELAVWTAREAVNKQQNKANEQQMKTLMANQLKEADPVKHNALQTQIDALAASLILPGEPPQPRRFKVNNATVEKLGELLNQNPNGLLVERDELSGLFKNLEDDNKDDREFYLSAWNGTGSYTYDRIGRGTIRIDPACLSIVGGIQPDLLRKHLSHSEDSDGMVQRFQLAVWPEPSDKFAYKDEYPDKALRDAMYEICERLADLDTGKLADPPGEYDTIPFVRFSDAAQPVFEQWYTRLNTRARKMGDNPDMSAHLLKFASLIPGLALVFWLTEEVPADYATNFNWLPAGIGLKSLKLAIEWGEFLEQHAERIYACKETPAMISARALHKKIQGGKLPNPFNIRDVYRMRWTDLTDKDSVIAAVQVLQEFDHIHTVMKSVRGKKVYENYINPKAL